MVATGLAAVHTNLRRLHAVYNSEALARAYWYTVKNNCKLTGFLACKITSFGRFSIITVFFL